MSLKVLCCVALSVITTLAAPNQVSIIIYRDWSLFDAARYLVFRAFTVNQIYPDGARQRGRKTIDFYFSNAYDRLLKPDHKKHVTLQVNVKFKFIETIKIITFNDFPFKEVKSDTIRTSAIDISAVCTDKSAIISKVIAADLKEDTKIIEVWLEVSCCPSIYLANTETLPIVDPPNNIIDAYVKKYGNGVLI